MRRSKFLVASALVFSVGCGSKQEKQAPSAVPVKVQVCANVEAAGGMRYSANVRPDVQVDIAFKVGGYASELLQVSGADGRRRNVQEGDHVTRGTVLARIRDTEYRDRLTEAQSALTQAKADLDRASQLYENQNISKADYDAATARETSAQARYDQAELTLRDAALVAPQDGTVLKKGIEVGTLVAPGQTAFVLASTDAVKVVFGVPDVLVGALKLGDQQTITTEAVPGVQFRGQVTRIAPSADPQSRVFDVECTIPNPEQRLKVGMVAALQVAPQQTKAPVAVVPLNAVVRPHNDPKGYAVFVVDDKDGRQTARERIVQLGEVVGNAIAVNEGLKAGEKVIVTGATLVADGQEVRIIP
jgi:RND family efflux transporter MFP subunit